MSNLVKPEDVVPTHFPDTLEGWLAAWIIRGFAREKSVPVEFSWGAMPVASSAGRNVILIDAVKGEHCSDAEGDYRSLLVFVRSEAASAFNGEAGLPIRPAGWKRTFPFGIETLVADGKVGLIHDRRRSLVGLVWDFFRGEAVMPRLLAAVDAVVTSPVNGIEGLDNADLVECVESYPLDFRTLDSLIDACQDTKKRELLLVGGEAIRRYKGKNGLM